MKYFLLLILLFAGSAGAAMEEHKHHDHEAMMKMPMPVAETDHGAMHGLMPHHSDDPATEAYMHIHHTMHGAMDIDFTGDADIDFLRGMIPHHQGAVDMAGVIDQYGADGSVKTFANKIVRDQVKEIRWMGALLETLEAERDGGLEPKRASVLANRLVNRKMNRDMMIDYTGNADVDFMVGMIPHHQGAVDMAHVVLKYGQDTRVKTLARSIIDAQVNEIRSMEQWIGRLKWRSARWR